MKVKTNTPYQLMINSRDENGRVYSEGVVAYEQGSDVYSLSTGNHREPIVLVIRDGPHEYDRQSHDVVPLGKPSNVQLVHKDLDRKVHFLVRPGDDEVALLPIASNSNNDPEFTFVAVDEDDSEEGYLRTDMPIQIMVDGECILPPHHETYVLSLAKCEPEIPLFWSFRAMPGTGGGGSGPGEGDEEEEEMANGAMYVGIALAVIVLLALLYYLTTAQGGKK